MQIAIKVPDDFYERVNKDGCMSYTDAEVVVNAFYCGKVLPKGHGRLIDADAMKTIKNIQSANFNAFELIRYWIDNQPTIIEADKEADE